VDMNLYYVFILCLCLCYEHYYFEGCINEMKTVYFAACWDKHG